MLVAESKQLLKQYHGSGEKLKILSVRRRGGMVVVSCKFCLSSIAGVAHKAFEPILTWEGPDESISAKFLDAPTYAHGNDSHVRPS
jgi:hypothetical protein